MFNDFWFKATLAVTEAVSKDLLIALHLTLDLLRDCLVLRMMLRDRTEGMSQHRIGDVGNELVAQIDRSPCDYSTGGILMMIEKTSQIYENLANDWSPTYTSNAKRDYLLDWARKARQDLAHIDIRS